MALVDFLTRPVAYHPALARQLGSINAAVMLSQAIYWQQRVPERRPQGCPGPDWWHHSIDVWESETALSKNEQITARKILSKTNFWYEKRAGVPARLWFRIDFVDLEKTLKNQQITTKRKTGYPQERQPDGRFTGNVSPATRTTLYSKITTETTTTDTNQEKKTGDGSSSVFLTSTERKVHRGNIVEQSQDNYLRLACLFGGIREPVGFEMSKRRQWKEQGGMSASDEQQLNGWKVMEIRAQSNKKNRIRKLRALELEDQKQATKAVEAEEKVLAGMSPELRRAIMSAKNILPR